MRSRTIYQKTEGVAETKKWKITAMLVNVTKKFFKRKHDARESTIRISKHERS